MTQHCAVIALCMLRIHSQPDVPSDRAHAQPAQSPSRSDARHENRAACLANWHHMILGAGAEQVGADQTLRRSTARILLKASSAATLYASDSVG